MAMLTKTSPPRPSHYHVPRYYYLTERDAGEYDVPPAFRGLRDPDIPGCEGFPYLYLSPAPAPAPIPIPIPAPTPRPHPHPHPNPTLALTLTLTRYDGFPISTSADDLVLTPG